MFAAMEEKEHVRPISHYCLMPMSRLKKIRNNHEAISQADVCIFGGFLAYGITYGGGDSSVL
jgi:hypothetical protein